jgi:hypothetical protein
MNFLADESVDGPVVDRLREDGHTRRRNTRRARCSETGGLLARGGVCISYAPG